MHNISGIRPPLNSDPRRGKAISTVSREVELQATRTAIQWRYKGFSKWIDLIAIKDLIGDTGPQGKPGKQGDQGIQGAPGSNGKDGKNGTAGLIGPQGPQGPVGPRGLPGEKGTAGLDGYDGKNGTNGKQIELNKSATHVQWRYVGDLLWKNLIPLSDLKGPQGVRGPEGKKGDTGAKGEPGIAGAPGTAGPMGPQGYTGPAGPAGAGVATGGTTGQKLVKASNTNYDTEWADDTAAQTYQTFTYNSSETSPSGNTFNDWALLVTALQQQSGPKLLIGVQDEVIDVGTWDLNETTIQGDNLSEYNAGGWTWTFPEGCYVTGLLAGPRGIRFLTTATTHGIWSPPSAYTFLIDTVANIHSTSYPFVSSSYAGQNVIAIRNSGRNTKLAGGVENFEFTGGAFTQQVIVSLSDGAVMTDDTLRSTNGVIYIPIIASVNQALANYPPTNANLVVGFQLDLNLTNSKALYFDPTGTTYNPANVDVDAILREIDARLVAGGL